jgi:putative flippase GtrA
MITGPLLKFLLVGAANTLMGLSVIWGMKEFTRASDATANVAGYAVGVTVSFLLNKRWTFGFRGERGASLLRFLIVFAVSYTVNLVTVLSLIEVSGLDSFWCQAFGVIPYSALFYLGCRWYAFPSVGGKSRDTRSAT